MKRNIARKNWIISILEIDGKYKVTRRVLEMSVAQTKMFSSKKKAKEQFDKWLDQC